MPSYSKLVRDFWSDMNRHSNAQYKKIGANMVAELDKDIHTDRAKLTVWHLDNNDEWSEVETTFGPTFSQKNQYITLKKPHDVHHWQNVVNDPPTAEN